MQDKKTYSHRTASYIQNPHHITMQVLFCRYCKLCLCIFAHAATGGVNRSHPWSRATIKHTPQSGTLTKDRHLSQLCWKRHQLRHSHGNPWLCCHVICLKCREERDALTLQWECMWNVVLNVCDVIPKDGFALSRHSCSCEPAIRATYQNASADSQLLMADSQIVLRLMCVHWEKRRSSWLMGA